MGGDETTLRSIERDLKTKDMLFTREGLGDSWKLMQILSRLGKETPASSRIEDETVESRIASDAMFGAIKDGIGFGLFISPFGTPIRSLIRAVPEEFMRHHIGDTEWIDHLLDACIESYEETYGVIQ